jgi:hypothetical protein
MIAQGWTFGSTRLTEEFTLENWRAEHPAAHLFARIDAAGAIKLIRKEDEVKPAPDVEVIALRPPKQNAEG